MAATAAVKAAKSMCPSPTMPRERSASGGSGVIQSPIWYDAIRAPARATWSSTPGSHHRWNVSTTTPTCSAGCCSAMSRAWARVDTTPRSAANIGCIGSIAEPHAAGAGVRGQLRDGVGGAVAGGGQVAVAGGRPPGTSTRTGAPRVAASSSARRLSSCASRRAAGSATVKKPPRQSDETRRPDVAQPATRRSPARPRRPVPATGRSPADRRPGNRRSPRAATSARSCAG